METAVKEATGKTVGERKKRKWGSRILHFLMYGGWMVVLVAVLAVVILLSSK